MHAPFLPEEKELLQQIAQGDEAVIQCEHCQQMLNRSIKAVLVLHEQGGGGRRRGPARG